METTFILTNLAPAIMLFLIAMIVRFFPPTRDSSGIITTAPQWWMRDQNTWNTAHKILSKRYLMYSLILAVFCVISLFLKTTYSATLGYGLLIIFFLLANFQVRAYMNSKVK